jgi:hypothetical protein
MAQPKRPELKLSGNVSENFKNFEVRFHDYCVQADYRDLDKDPDTQQLEYYKKPLREIAALRSALPDEALQVIRYTIDPQISNEDKKKPWRWMEELREHYTGTTGSSLMTDRFTFWTMNQTSQDNIQEWEDKIRQSGSLCAYGGISDELCRDKFVFGLDDSSIRAELLKTHMKPDNTPKTLPDVVAEAKAMESAQKANKLIGNRTQNIEEQVHWVSHKDLKLKREPGTCYWCGDKRGPHPWKTCAANGKTCLKCGKNDHFARVCLEEPNLTNAQEHRNTQNRGRGRGRRGGRGQYQNRASTHGQYNPSQDHKVHSLGTDDTYFEEDLYDEDQQCYTLETQEVHTITGTSSGKRYFVNLPMSTTGQNFTTLKFQIDTAATCNTISAQTLTTILPEVELKKSPYLLHPYGDSEPIRPLGQIDMICERAKRYDTLRFQVLPEKVMRGKPALLSGSDCEKLGLIKIEADEVFSITSEVKRTDANQPDNLPGYKLTHPKHTMDIARHQDVEPLRSRECNHLKQIHYSELSTCNPKPTPSKPMMIPASRRLPTPGELEKEHIMKQYPQVFDGIGKLGPPVHFKVKENVTPIQMPVHRIPVAKRQTEKEALDKYVKLGFMAKVEEPTPWCSNEVIRQTPKKVRICIDPSQTVNKAILRPVHQMQTLNEQLHKLCNAKCFSIVDVKDGFLHVPLDEESSYMTTMHTSFGRYRWLRLPFGITSAPEEFQMRLNTALEGLEGTACIADDILIYGEGDTKEEAQQDHDRRFVALMERCIKENIKLNPDKVQFKLKEVKFMGNLLSEAGMKADPDKISAITQMPAPHNKAALQRYNGMINYLSPYCQNLSSVMRPLTRLTQDDVPFIWSRVQEEAFKRTKALIAAAPVLMYYDLQKPVVLQVDASEEGLGGALLQPNNDGKLQPVAFTSNSLSKTEQRYSQIEKECLAICNAFGKFDHWLFGKSDIEVHTDHQPLETILKKPLNKAPARLQKMMMRLQRYRFTVSYRKGTSMHLADTLSRAALPTPVHAKVTGFEVFRIELEKEYEEDNPRLIAETEKQMQGETMKDVILSQLYTLIVQGWPGEKNQLIPGLQPYWAYRDELTIQNGIIYKGLQVLVPQAMQATMLRKIHVNHFGPESNKRMAREVLFWPGMGKSIHDMCSACSICAQYGQSAPKEPMKSLPVPTLPWQIVSQDIFAYDKKAYLVTVCHFSDWIEVDELEDTLATTVVNKTKSHFARFGIPKLCHTDNGPQFISKEYKTFSEEYNFSHTTSSPYYPQGNGRAEAAVKVAKSMLKKSNDLQLALLNYRNTPPQGHSYSPAQRVLYRRTRTTLPTSDKLLMPSTVDIQTVTREIMRKRVASKEYYDRQHNHTNTPIDVGTYVYAKPPPNKRGGPWAYGKVVAKEGPRSYTIQAPNSTIRRNRIDVRAAAPPPSPGKNTKYMGPAPLISPTYIGRRNQPNTRPQTSNGVEKFVPHTRDISISNEAVLKQNHHAPIAPPSPTVKPPITVTKTRTRTIKLPGKLQDYILQ